MTMTPLGSQVTQSVLVALMTMTTFTEFHDRQPGMRKRVQFPTMVVGLRLQLPAAISQDHEVLLIHTNGNPIKRHRRLLQLKHLLTVTESGQCST